LESLTDSNGDVPPEGEADEAKEENRSESERPEEQDEEEGDGDVTMRAGDLEIEVEGGQEEEQKGEKVVQDTHMDESGETGDQEAQADEEAQPEEPVEEEIEEAPRKLDESCLGPSLQDSIARPVNTAVPPALVPSPSTYLGCCESIIRTGNQIRCTEG
jgi:hypothetical protein